MRKITACAAAVGLMAVLTALTFSENESGKNGKARLPGAKETIEARNYPSLQAALDALPPEGGMVRLPPGTFEIERPLRIGSDDVRIEGAGTATHIRNVNEEGEPALVIEPPKGKKSLWRVSLSNFRITGNPKSGDGIVARKVDEIFVHGVTVSYHGGNGILLDHCYEDPRVCNSLITYNKKTGLELLGCHDIVVSANQFEENLDALTCKDSFNLCMTGNNLDDHLRHGVVMENTYGSVLSGNMIEECQGTAVVLDRDCYGITISANVIAHDFGGGVDLRDAHGCAVSANTFTIVPQRAVTIGPDSGRITVSANNFSDSYIGDGLVKRREDDRAAAGVTLQGASDVTVSGNLFSGLDSGALDVTDASTRRILFSDNVMSEADAPAVKPEDSLIENNLGPEE